MNLQTMESQLKKKNNTICNHAVQESVAMGESLCAHVRSEDNYVDILTKVLTGQKQQDLVQWILYDIYDDHDKTT